MRKLPVLWLALFLVLVSQGFASEVAQCLAVDSATNRAEDALNKKAELICEKGLKLEEKGNLSEAEKKFKAALQINPKYGPAYTYLGELYQNQKRYGEAETTFKKQIEIHPESPLAWNNLAALYVLQKRWQDAKEAYQKSLEINWNQPDVMNDLRRLEEEIREKNQRD